MGDKSFQLISATVIILILISASLWTGARALPLAAVQQPSSDLTGRIFDHGEDTDGDGLFNYLAVDVEVEVNAAGTYEVGIGALRDVAFNSVYFNAVNSTQLDAGTHNVSVLLSGFAIYGSRTNVAYANSISLSYQAGYSRFSTQRYEIPLLKTYDYTLFDNGAALTGKVSSQGLDVNGNDLFDYLKVTVEINVTDEAEYGLTVSEMSNSSEYTPQYVPVWNSTEVTLLPGLQNMTVSFSGAMIYASHATNISEIDSITLEVIINSQRFKVDSASLVPMDKSFNYLEFEPLARFTGRVFDVAVDEDGNSKYDYLELSVEVNVTESGYYNLVVQDLLGQFSNSLGTHGATTLSYLEMGVQLVNVTIYGPAIYKSHIDPVYIERMDIYNSDMFSFAVDSFSNVPLPTLYGYTDFERHAYFIGTHSDVGVDTDSDGLFDYLAVGIDVNFTEPGRYGIYTDKLDGQSGSSLYTRVMTEGQFTRGVHTVYLNFSGPFIAQSHFNPMALASVTLFEDYPSYFEVDTLSYIPFSKLYEYRLFDAPMRDTKIDFVVFPNGTVSIGGELNFTHTYPSNTYPSANITIDFSTEDNTTTRTANGTFIFPPSLAPLNSTTGHLTSSYADGQLNATLDASLSIPSDAANTWPFNTTDFNFNSSYSNGMLDAHLSGQTLIPSQTLSTYPFNITDIVVLLQYDGNHLAGNITFRAASGLPLGDITVYVDGNRTNVNLTGNLTVLYGNFGGRDVNSATIDDTLGNLTNEIQNVTQGSLEVTHLNTTKTPLYEGGTEYGANVDFNITLHGNFTAAMAKLLLGGYTGYSSGQISPVIDAAAESLASSARSALLELVYYRASQTATFDIRATSDVKAALNKAMELVPAAVPSENRTMVEAWLEIENATADAYKNLSFNASYSSNTQTLNLQADVLTDSSLAEKEVLRLLPDSVPPELHEAFETYVNTTYARLKTQDARFDSTLGTVNFVISEIYEGDYKAELNREKRFIIDYLNAVTPSGPYVTPSIFVYPFMLLNDTEIDVNNFKARLDIGSDSICLNFSGVILQPPKDEIDSIRFKLSKLFNMTAGYNFTPTEYDKLDITIEGGTEGNQTVLLNVPSMVPAPATESLDYARMTWLNISPSSLTDLHFLVAYQARINYGGLTEPVPIVTNSTISSFSFNPNAKSISFNVEGPPGTGFCNVTIPKSVLYASSNEWIVKVDGVPLSPANFTVAENDAYVFIYLTYQQSSHSVEIAGTKIVPELNPNLPLVFLILISLATLLIAVRRRKKLTHVKAHVTRLASRRTLSFFVYQKLKRARGIS